MIVITKRTHEKRVSDSTSITMAIYNQLYIYITYDRA